MFKVFFLQSLAWFYDRLSFSLATVDSTAASCPRPVRMHLSITQAVLERYGTIWRTRFGAAV